jgi:ADP-ribose pyrophosphatase YjhB (NUDIX family)
MAVYYAEPPKDLLGGIPEGTVVSADDLVAALKGGGVRMKAVHRPRVAALPTADIVIFTIRSKVLHVLLIKRAKVPFRGRLALPGGFIRPGESLEDTAKRELFEETGLDASRIPLQQVHTYSQPDRDPRGRVLTTAFLAIAPDLPEAQGGTDAARADWIEVENSLWRDPERLAFDHGEILQLALERTRELLEHTTVAADFCGRRFTIGNLRVVYEAVWGMPVNAQNFQRKVRNAKNFLIPIGAKSSAHPGRPADLFRRGAAQVLNPPMLRPSRRGSRSPDDL